MVLTNPYYALLDTYISSINKLSCDANIKSEYKIEEAKKDNFHIFNCFNIISHWNLENGILLKEIKYEGALTFSFNEATNEVYVTRIPYVYFMNTKMPIFTSDIAKIMIEILKMDIKISFEEPILPLVIDAKVKDIIPDIVNTSNCRLVTVILNKLEQEKRQIIQDVKHYQEKEKRLEEGKNRALAKKRKIMDLDPCEFTSITEFQKELSQKLIKIWQRKIRNIKRHLKINCEKYKAYLAQGSPENIADTLELAIFEKLGVKSNISFENVMARVIDFSPEVKRMLKLRQYFCDHVLDDTINNKQNLNSAVCYILDYDLHSDKGVISSIKKARSEDDLKKTAHKTGLSYSEVSPYIFYEIILRETFEAASKHPIYSKDYEQVKYLCGQYHNDFFVVAKNMKRVGFDLKPWDLIMVISSLEQQLIYYQNLIKNPRAATLKFFKTSKIWGSIMMLPYWYRLYHARETFGLFMVQRGVERIDYEKIINFLENPRSKEKPLENKIIEESELGVNRLIVTIPHSLSYFEIEKLIDYSHNYGEMLNFICEDEDVAIIVKKVLIKKSVLAYTRNQEYFKGWCFINIDPTYYESFMVDTPNSETLWHRYDYSSNYKYHRSYILSFDYLVKRATKYSLNGEKSLDYGLLEAILLGSYDENPIIKDEVEEFYATLKPKTEALKKELLLTKNYLF